MKHSISLLVKLLLCVILFQSCTAVNGKYSKDRIEKHILPIDNVIEMHDEYDRKRIQLLQEKLRDEYQNPKFEDTKFVWMPLEDLKAYVSYIEAIKNANPEDNVSGIRLYFAAYPNKRQLNDREIKYPGQQTAFMVPTVESFNRNERFPTMNHLPFAIKPESDSNPIKGSFVILEKLMLGYHNGRDRVKRYYENSKQNRPQGTTTGSQGTTGAPTGFSARSSAVRNNEELISTAYNEFQLAPPPKKGDN